jgi:hypothetical protein
MLYLKGGGGAVAVYGYAVGGTAGMTEEPHGMKPQQSRRYQ